MFTSQRPGTDGVSVAFPICDAGADPHVVITFDLALDSVLPAAVETWSADDPRSTTLSLHQGWYSAAAMPMARLSRHTRIPRGFGLPGLAWQLRSPAYLGRLGMSELFVRAYSAMQIGLQHGLAIPATVGDAALVLLSGPLRPIARRVELAAIDATGARCIGGFCQRHGDLGFDGLVKPWGAALIEDAAASNAPRLALRGIGTPDHSVFAGSGADAVLVWPFRIRVGRPVVLSLWL